MITAITRVLLLVGLMSPYPTVVAVTKDQYQLSNGCQPSFFPTSKPNPLMSMANVSSMGAVSQMPTKKCRRNVNVRPLSNTCALRAASLLRIMLEINRKDGN